jgi:hypothetical protein
MTKQEQAHINRIVDQVNVLMNGQGNGITNADVIEAMLDDIQRLRSGTVPQSLATLIQHDHLMNRTGLGA